MSRNQASSEPHDGHHRQPPDRDREPDEREPANGSARPDRPDDDEVIGNAHRSDDDDDDDDHERVAHRPSHLPERDVEDDEDDLAEADMMERLDLDDLKRLEGPDA